MKIPSPKEMSHLIGYDDLQSELCRLIEQKRLPHGILLSGPKGSGKATFAYHLARYLLKGGTGDFSLNPQSSVFRQVLAGSHPDLITVTQEKGESPDLSKEIPVEQARAVVHFFQQKPMLGQWRVAIIDSIDELSHKGANSLLKILEEPPSHCLLILLTHNIEKVLPTIRSRSQHLPCPLLTPSEVAQVLSYLNLDLTEAEQEFIVQVSEGRIGYGLNILKLGGQAFYEAMLTVFHDLAHADYTSLFPFIDKFIINHPELGKEEAWQLGTQILQDWLATRLAKVIRQEKSWAYPREEAIAHEFFSNRSFDAFAGSWFTANHLVQLSKTFNLDKKQTLICFFARLTGLIER